MLSDNEIDTTINNDKDDTLITPQPRSSIHFVTGKLAEPALREIVGSLASKQHFDYTIEVLPITVAALMTPNWLLKHMRVPSNATRVILPGYLQTGIEAIRAEVGEFVECGPKDVRDLPILFGKKRFKGEDYGQFSIEIIAEINYAPRLTLTDLIEQAKTLVKDGANRIDLGCEPGFQWNAVADAVRVLADEGIATSIDTFDPWEAEAATQAGASLVLSVNKTNREAAIDWGCEVVVVPDDLSDFIPGMLDTAEFLSKHRVPFRLDPILEPIGCGFANSLGRVLKTRDSFPEAAMMMGIGNVTELTDCDSAGLNTLLLDSAKNFRSEVCLPPRLFHGLNPVFANAVFARRLVNYAIRHKVPPKHLEERLVMLRDPLKGSYSAEMIASLASSIKDNNYRILLDESQIHLISCGVHIQGRIHLK